MRDANAFFVSHVGALLELCCHVNQVAADFLVIESFLQQPRICQKKIRISQCSRYVCTYINCDIATAQRNTTPQSWSCITESLLRMVPRRRPKDITSFHRRSQQLQRVVILPRPEPTWRWWGYNSTRLSIIKSGRFEAADH